MSELRTVIDDIRVLLKKGSFRDEQHVRISLVTRLCKALNWNVWDPTEYYTEYPVKQYPKHEISADYPGRVDVALIITENDPDTAEVFIEVKNAGKLQTEMAKGELQLQKYNFWDKSVISILTDGVIWRFYLPSLAGAFSNMLFNQINLLEDNPDQICIVFDKVLNRDNFSKKAKETAQEMHRELKKIRLVDSVKAQAESIANTLGTSAYAIAQQLLKNTLKTDMGIEEIESLWNRSIPGGQTATPPPPDPNPPKPPEPGSADNQRGKNDLPPKPKEDYSFKKVKRACVLGEWHDLKFWWQVKKEVYNKLLDRLKGDILSKCYGVSTDKSIYKEPITLNNGYYTEGSLSSNNVVWHCYVALHNLGHDPAKDLVIETEGGKASSKKVDENTELPKKPTKVFVIDTWFAVRNYLDIKEAVYNHILRKGKKIPIDKPHGITQSPIKYKKHRIIEGGYYIYTNLTNMQILEECKWALMQAGFSEDANLIVE